MNIKKMVPSQPKENGKKAPCGRGAKYKDSAIDIPIMAISPIMPSLQFA
jgi:hypothetical protein